MKPVYAVLMQAAQQAVLQGMGGLLATSPFVLMRAFEMAFPFGTRIAFTMPPAVIDISNSLHHSSKLLHYVPILHLQTSDQNRLDTL